MTSGGKSPPQGPKGRALLCEVMTRSRGFLLGLFPPARESEERPVRIDIFIIINRREEWCVRL